ncbi:MAG: flagellar hook-length control protein FliK [Lachnospiraceae bacterium]|nr:flagellar hook-length control protein FliK [Lachnospiraceae bacterium]
MGINAVASEKYTADNVAKNAAKKQNDAFKSLIDMAAKKQNFDEAGTKVPSQTDSKAGNRNDAKVDKNADNEVAQLKEEDKDTKKDDLFENEKNIFIGQAFLARNAVDVVNIEIEPVQEVVLTAASEIGEIAPQQVETTPTVLGQEVMSQKSPEEVGQVVIENPNTVKESVEKTEPKSDVAQGEKPTFKLADESPKAILPEKNAVEAEGEVDNSHTQVKNQAQTQAKEDAPEGKVTGKLMVEDEKVYAKKDNLEVNSEPQITNSQAKDVVVIKVADPVSSSTAKELTQKLGNEIIVKLDSGANQFHAVLNPKGLGEIAVKLSVEGGKVLVSMACSNEATKTLLQNNVSSLVKIVEGGMGQETVVNIYNEKNSGQENFDGQGNRGQYQGNSQNNQGNSDEKETDFIQKLRLGIMEMEGM